jgi:DNA-binding NarL/FixJ family response regulator
VVKNPKPGGGILIVDDHPVTVGLLLDLIGAAFPQQPLRTAGSAEEAMATCQLSMPEVAVLDIGLPASSGFVAASRMKALSGSIGVVIHSIFDHEIYREQSIAAGADAFVSKTRTYAELVPTIARLLAQA